MPRFDRTGPEGQGSQTGRQLGRCNRNAIQSKNKTSDDDTPRGLGLRRGRRWGGFLRNSKGKGSEDN